MKMHTVFKCPIKYTKQTRPNQQLLTHAGHRELRKEGKLSQNITSDKTWENGDEIVCL